MKLIDRMVEYFTRLNKKMKRWQRVVSILSAIVVFATTYMLVMPAITLDVDTASTQAGIEVASENEPDTAGTVFESTEEEEPEEPEAEPAEEEETSGSVSSAQEEEAEPASEQEEAVESDSEQEEAVESAPAEQEEESAEPASDEQEEEAEEAQSGSSETEAAQSGSGSADSTAAEDSSEDASVQEAADAAKTTAETAKTTAETAKTAVTEDTPLIKEPTQLTYKGNDYTVYADFDESAKLPVGVELRVKEITKDSDPDAYDTYYKKALEELKDKYDENTGVSFAKFYDIAFVYNGQEIEPQGSVAIKIEYKKAVEIEEETKIDTIHFDKEDADKAEIIDSEKEVTDKTKVESVEFESDKFSVYGIIGAETFTEKYLTEDGETYNISVTASPEAHIPSDARLEVSEVKAGSDKYNELFAKAEEAVLDGRDGSVPFARFFDISIVKDGEKIQPDVPVEVKITFDETVEADKNAVFNAVHISGNKTDVIDVTTEGEESEKAVTVEAVQFSADGFSIYGVTYTVDFEYTDPITGKTYYFSLNGEDSIDLTDLLVALGIKGEDEVEQFVAEEVENVEFSDPELVEVIHKDNNWVLKSLASFNTEETLSISLKNGEKIAVKVTDPPASHNLQDYLRSVAIDAPQNDQGAYIVREGDKYSITLGFAESSRQFPNSGEMSMPLPEGLDADGVSGHFSIQVNTRTGVVNVPNNTYRVENGILYFNWSTDPSVERLFAQNNASFSITITGEFDGSETHLHFSDSIEKDIEVDRTNSVSASKIASVDKENNKINYTVNVQSTGNSTGVVITDTITGQGITLDPGSIRATSNKTATVDLSNGTINGNTFTYTIPSMSNGEIITFTYSADIDPTAIAMVGGKVETTANNGATVHSDGDPTPDTANTSNTISYTPDLSKSNGTIVSTTETATTLQWTLTANNNPVVSMAGGTITDTIDAESRSIMTYSGGGITVVVKDASGNEVRPPQLVHWNELTDKSDYSWTYTVPTGDAGHAYIYEITYTTDVNTTQLTSLTTVKNKGTTDGGKEDSGEGKVGPSGEVPEIQKDAEFVDLSNKEVSWVVTFTVPKDGLSKAVVTDTYPIIDEYNSGTGYAFIEQIKGQLTRDNIVGLQDTEDFTVEYNEKNFVITFYKDSSHSAPGLNGGESTRVITVNFKTEIDEEWLEHAKAVEWQIEHKNIVKLDCGSEVEAEDTVIIQGEDVKKKVEPFGTRTVDGAELPVYKYTIDLKGVTSTDITITDTFDTSILEPYINPNPTYGNESFYIWGGDQYTWNREKAAIPVSYLLTAEGLTFQTSEETLPVSDQGYYSNYRLIYFLTVKDVAAWNKLMGYAAASEDGKYNLENNAEWGTHGDTASVEFTYEGLNKEILTSDSDLVKTDEEIIAEFRITLNPGGLVLNNMEPLTMTDEYENLSVIFDTIEANPSEGVRWDFSGNVGTYTIPDATKVVITYKARVIRSTNESATIHFKNVATMGGFQDYVEKDAQYTSTGQGSAGEVWISLLKYEAGDMTHTLAGAEFELWEIDEEGNEKPIVYPEWHDKAGQTVSFITGASGRIDVVGDEKVDGWSIYSSPDADGKVHQYFLRETVAPTGYMLSDFDYEFRISTDGTTDYSEYIYHNGDIMSAKNYPGTDILVEKEWSDGNEKHESDSVTVKVQQRRKTGADSEEWTEWSDSIRKEVKITNEGGGTSYEWQDVEMTVTLNKDNDWKGKFASLPLVVPSSFEDDAQDVDAEYQLVETLVNGESPVDGTVQIIGPTAVGGAYSYIIKNTVVEGSLKLTKAVKVNGNDPDDNNKALTDGQYDFDIRKAGSETVLHTVSITYAGGVITSAKVDGEAIESIPEDNYIEVTDLEAGDYTITEKTPTNGSILSSVTGGKSVDQETKVVTVTVEPGKTADVVTPAAKAEFTNNVELTKATVKKVWSGSNPPDSLSATLVINGEVSTDPTHTVTLNSGNGWEQSIDNLPKYKNGERIEYSWLEGEMPEGFYLANEETTETETGGAAEIRTTLTNTMSTYELTTSYVGKKTWVDQSDKYLTRPENLVVTLQRAVGDGAYEDLSLTPKWTKNNDEWIYTFENLPVFSENGEVYKYRAKETVPGGYTGEVEDQKDTEYSLGTITWENGRDRVTPNNQVIWTLDSLIDLSFVAIKPTASGPVAIWTSRTPLPSEKQALIDMIRGNALPGCSGRNIVFYVGTGDVHTPHGDVHVDFDKDNLKVTLDFGLTEVWAQFLVGQFNKNGSSSYDIGKTDFKNTLETVDLSGTKTWKILGEAPSDPILTLTRTVTTTVDGEETTSHPEVVTVKEGDETVNLQPDWSGEGKIRTYTYSNLPKKDKNGNEYTYSVAEAKFTIGTGEDQVTYTVTKSEDGSYSVSADKQGAPQYIVTQDGNYIDNEETKEFEFTKIWMKNDTIKEWPAGETISISLYSKTGTGAGTKIEDFVLSAAGGTTGDYTWIGTKNSDNTYTFKITGLPATDSSGAELSYYVIEKKVDGYKDPIYAIKAADAPGGFINQENGAVLTNAADKGYIINKPDDSVTLPESGGPGTTLFYGLGIALAAMAGLLLFIKKRNLRNLSERRW